MRALRIAVVVVVCCGAGCLSEDGASLAAFLLVPVAAVPVGAGIEGVVREEPCFVVFR